MVPVLLYTASFLELLSTFFALRLSGPSWVNHNKPIDWTHCSSTHTDLVTDVIAPSPWTIFGCQNGKNKVSYMLFEVTEVVFLIKWIFVGLRLFKEAKDRDSPGKVD